MPIIKSARKALRQSKKRQKQNLVFKANFKNAVKEFRHLIVSQNLEKAAGFLPAVYQAVDKAAKKGVIKKNTANRYKSRLAVLLKKK